MTSYMFLYNKFDDEELFGDTLLSLFPEAQIKPWSIICPDLNRLEIISGKSYWIPRKQWLAAYMMIEGLERKHFQDEDALDEFEFHTYEEAKKEYKKRKQESLYNIDENGCVNL